MSTLFTVLGSFWAVLSSNAVALPRPVDRLGGKRLRNLPLVELTLGLVEPVAALDQAESQSASTGALHQVGGGGFVEAEMFGRQPSRQPLDLGTVERRQAVSHVEFGAAGGAGRTEPARPLD